MLTRKTRFVILYLRIGFFRLPIILPMRCIHEVFEGYQDLFAPFRFFCEKIWGYLSVAEGAMLLVKNYEPLDLVDVDVKSKSDDGRKERVILKIVTR